MKKTHALLPAALLAALGGLAGGTDAHAATYLLTAARPNQLVLVNATERKVERTYPIPGDGIPSVVALSPDSRIAYVLTNRWESVSGIDLDTGKEVFRADMSEPGLRVKTMFAMTVSADGKELYVHQIPTRLKATEYQVEPTRIAVYDTAAGLGARPKKTFPAPRSIVQLLPARDGGRVYALGRELFAFDTHTGQLAETLPLQSWKQPNLSAPDVLAVWPQWEQSGVFATPYYAARTDLPADSPEAFRTGLLTLDLKTGAMKATDFEPTAVVIFSSVINPVKHDEAFSVYTQLSKIDLAGGRVAKRIDLDHTYYSVNISADGKEVYVGGALGDIAVYSSDTLEKLATIPLPGGVNMSTASMRVVQR